MDSTVALCIGATTAIFGLVYTVLLRPLLFEKPEEILPVRTTYPMVALRSE